MSYLDELKQQITDGRSEKVQVYKDYMSEFVVPEMVDSVTKNSVVYAPHLESEGINYELFIAWLSWEGIDYNHTTKGDGIIIEI